MCDTLDLLLLIFKILKLERHMSTLENERSGKGVTVGIPAEIPKEKGEEEESQGEPSLLTSDEDTEETTTSRKRK